MRHARVQVRCELYALDVADLKQLSMSLEPEHRDQMAMLILSSHAQRSLLRSIRVRAMLRMAVDDTSLTREQLAR